MPETIFGLPLHPLVVHATVVIVPLTAVVLAMSVVNERFRRWAGPLPLGLAVVSEVLAPVSTSTGENLQELVGTGPLVERHAELGRMLVWWCIGMLVVAASSYLLRRRGALTGNRATVLLVAGILVATGALVQVALVGHSGAKAVWSGIVAANS
jgi:hypothetical protein